jgi:chorismate synthase
MMRTLSAHLCILITLTATITSLGLRFCVMSSGNSFGKIFRISTFGESHGPGVGVIIDGCPPRIPIKLNEFQEELDRRKPGQSRLTTPRDEEDKVEILSGISNDLTMGTPISLLVRNKDQRSGDYDELALKYRPSHADATYDAKYGVRAVAGGGRSSARETVGRVAAGVLARKILHIYSGVEIIAYVKSVQDIILNYGDTEQNLVTRDMVGTTFRSSLRLKLRVIYVCL